MEYNDIHKLLEKYWSCETSLEEEKIIRDYFQNKDVSESLKEQAALFLYLEQQRNQKIKDQSFDYSLKTKPVTAKSKRRSLFMSSMRIAAGIGVVAVSFWLLRTELNVGKSQEPSDTYSDPKQAFEETKRALQLISKNFGKAEKATSNINLINEAKTKVQSKQNTKVDS